MGLAVKAVVFFCLIVVINFICTEVCFYIE